MARWWHGPQLRTDEDEQLERRTSWLELFYDLVFVAVITHLSLILSRGVTSQSVWQFVLLTIPIWWVWVGGTIYHERFESDDVSYRMLVFVQMVPVLGLAVNVQGAFGDRAEQFAIAYIASRIVMIALWLRGAWHEPRVRPLAYRYITGFALAAACWTVSLAFPSPWRYALWALGLFIDLVTPLFTIRVQEHLPAFSTTHLPERFGLFTMIVLGESVLAIVTGIAALVRVPFILAIVTNLGLAIIFGLWWIYYDQAMRPLRRAHGGWRMLWNYLHLPLVMSIVALGAGIRLMASGALLAPLEPVQWLACAATAGALATIGLLQMLTRPVHRVQVRVVSPVLKLVSAAGALVLGFFATGLGVIPLLAVLTALVGVHAAFDAFLWYTRQEAYSPSE